MSSYSRILRRLRTANENASSFASKIPTITEPTNDGVVRLDIVPCKLILWPFLLGSDNDVSSIRIIGWHKVVKTSSLDLWVPTILGEFACTASACVGVAGAAVLDTERFCDTITPVAARIEDAVIGAGTAVHSDVNVLSPVNDTPAHIIMPLRGMERFEITSDQTTGTATFNCLFSFLDDDD